MRRTPANRFRLTKPNAELLIDVTQPKEINAVIEPNILTAPGRPGSVDKGESQQRGVRLAVSTSQATTTSTISLKLQVRKIAARKAK